MRMQEYLSQVKHYSYGLNLSIYCTSLEVETCMLTILPLFQPPRRRTCLELSLLKTCANLLR